VSEVFAAGRIADLILGLLVVEGVVLFAWWRITGRGLAPALFAGNLLAGAGFVLALRGALVQSWWGWIGLALALALVGHVVDLWRRWRD
jgi:hypothetical protein